MRRLVFIAVLMTATGCEEPEPLVRSRVVAITAGDAHTCALLEGGAVRCFGRNEFGQLGYGTDEPIGDDEHPAEAGDVPLGAPASVVVAGGNHTCAITGGDLRCWGENTYGQLGRGDMNHVGDDEPASSAGTIDLGGVVVGVAVGGLHTCALMEGGAVRCFGDNTNGQLGYGNTEDIGDDEPASVVGDVDVGDSATRLVTGHIHTCTGHADGSVRCWGRGRPPIADAPGGWGQLGYGTLEDIGDDEAPSTAGPVDVGGPVVELAAGHFHQCARLEDGAVRCWGRGEGGDNFGQLGLAREESIGDDEPASAGGDIALGGDATAIAAGDVHTCAILDGGRLRCFGFGGFGQLGYGNGDDIGDDELPMEAGDVELGGAAVDVAIGIFHTCVLMDTSVIRCFGLAAGGELGTGNQANIGDDETPATIEPVLL